MTKTQRMKLNRQQLEAIKHSGGPLLIIAGAGTGKTTVVTERIKYLILSKLAKPDEILALTFTEKASKEMEERVDIAMPYGYTQMWISTFHSFCDRILKAEALHMGFDPRYKLMTQTEATQFVRNNLFKFNLNYFRPLGNPTKYVSAMLQHFSRLQDEDITPKEYLAYSRKISKSKTLKKQEGGRQEIQNTRELAEAYELYERLKVKEGLMDFGDLITKTLHLFRTRPNVLKRYRDKFKYVLVDEFQDTNFAQNELAILLAGKSRNITVCGDDDQSIYRFRGAAVSNIVQFRRHFPRSKMVVLTKNYRSTQEILDRAYDLIQRNNPDRLEAVEKIDKRLISQKPKKKEEVEFIYLNRVENEADAVAKKIEELTDGKYEYSDIAVLVRANNHSEPFARAFSRHAIPFQFLGPGRLFKQEEIIDLISYLKVIYDFNDSIALYRLLSMEDLQIPPRDLVVISSYSRRYGHSLFEACEKIDSLPVTSGSKEKIKEVVGMINKHIKLARKETAGQILYYFMTDTGLIEKMLSPESVGAQKKAANISKFFDRLKSYEVTHQDSTVPAVVEWVDLSSELGESPLVSDGDWNKINAVNILTVHSAKGLEFPVVFLVNLVEQRFPSMDRREALPIPDALVKEVLPVGDYHIEEERRLFYVGMTRAMDLLFFTAADYYGDAKRKKKISPFVFEALGDKVAVEQKSQDGLNQLSFLDFSSQQAGEVFQTPPKLQVDYLSYSQIDTFRTCPLHYKLKYILRLPTPQSASQSFGTSIHAALKNFYELVLRGEKPTRGLIRKCLKDGWVAEGFRNKSHQEKFFEKGILYLDGFLKEGFDPKGLPSVMEQPFNVGLNLRGRNSLKIGGKMDRVDVLRDGTVEIIDYKTGASVPSQKEVDKDLQLSFYALAASMVPQRPLGIDVGKIKLSLYFLDTQEKISSVRTKEQLREAVEEIFRVREEIENSDFKCSGHIFCQNCEYSLLCGADPK